MTGRRGCSSGEQPVAWLPFGPGVSVQLLFQGSIGFIELDVETASAQQVAHPKNHLLAIERLGQKVVRAEEESAVPSCSACVAGEHDDRQKAEALTSAAQAPQDFESVGCRHMQV